MRCADLRAWLRGERLVLALLAAFYVVSLIHVLSAREEQQASRPGEVVLRLCHWQLETACREAFEAAFARYRELHPHVRIVQLPVGGNTGAYNQWLQTQLLGNMAPDLIEIPGMPYPVLLSFCSRYFVPFTRFVAQPNPYNRGTSLEHVPWRETFVDSLNCAYVPELQEYYGAPMTIVNVRLYYNVELFRRLTGLERPPLDFRAFLAACERIRSQRDARGRPYVAIAGSQFSYSVLAPRILGALSHKILYTIDGAVDKHCDGYANQDELYFAWLKGLVNFREPPFRLGYQATRRITDQFQDGWNGMDRDQSLFIFTQQRAVMIPTGTWDYRSLASQSPFELAVCEFPLPSPSDPEYGSVVAGPLFEKPFGDARFTINAKSPHFEQALDFLRWFLSQETNAWFCEQIRWLPSIRGARIPPEVLPFQPHTDGVQGIDLHLGNQTGVELEQLKPLFWLHRIDYDELVSRYTRSVKTFARRDYDERTADLRRQIYSREATAVCMRGRWMTTGDPETRDRIRRKYFEFVCDLANLPGYVLWRTQIADEAAQDQTHAEIRP